MSIEVVKIQEFKGHTQAIYALAFDPGTKKIYSGSGDGMLVVWNLNGIDGNLLVRHPASVYSLTVGEGYLVSGQRNGDLTLFALNDLENRRSKNLSDASIFEIIINDHHLYIASQDGYIRKLNFELELIWKVKVSDKSVRTIVIDGEIIFAGTSEGEVVELNTGGEILNRFKAHEGTVFSLLVMEQGKKVLTGGKDAFIKMFENGGEISSVPAHLLHVHRLCINFDGSWFLSSSMDKSIKLWKTEGLELLKVIDFERHGGHTSSVNKILWIDKNTLISCSDDRTIKCFEIREK